MAIKRLAAQGGFTLLEMMVVIAIIGIIATGVMFSVSGGNERTLDVESQRLRDTLQLAVDQSVLGGTDIGVTMTEQSYGFIHYDFLAHRWLTYATGAFAHHALPAAVKLSLEVARDQVVLAPDDKAEMAPPHPTLLFLSSGERDPFILTLADPTHKLAVRLGSDGVSHVALLEKP